MVRVNVAVIGKKHQNQGNMERKDEKVEVCEAIESNNERPLLAPAILQSE